MKVTVKTGESLMWFKFESVEWENEKYKMELILSDFKKEENGKIKHDIYVNNFKYDGTFQNKLDVIIAYTKCINTAQEWIYENLTSDKHTNTKIN